jgi:hemerythrin superfamily protein
MFEFLTTNPAFALLKKDHDTVKDLFDKFEKAEGRPAKTKIVEQALMELKVHASIEEETFYPAVRNVRVRCAASAKSAACAAAAIVRSEAMATIARVNLRHSMYRL